MAITDKAIIDTLLKQGKGSIQVVLNGKVETLATVQEVNVPYEANTSTAQFIGTDGEITIVDGYAKTGTMTLAYNATIFRDFVSILSDGGDLPSCQLILENKGTATTGNQRLILNGVQFTSFSIFKNQANKGVMTESVKFSYENFKLSEKFNR